MARRLSASFCLVMAIGMAACAGHPVQMGIYTPYPREDMMAEVQKKVVSMGYTIQRYDSVNFELVADRTIDPPVDGASKEELVVQIAPDQTGSTKMIVTSSRILPATANRPVKRVTASAKTNADANALIQLYMKGRPKTGVVPS
jgi:hypothetical protein